MTDNDRWKKPEKLKDGTVDREDEQYNKLPTVEQLARSRVNELKAFIYKYLRDRDLAEEMAQESFTRLLNRLKKPGVKDAGAYLFRTASNVVRDHLRRQKTNPVDHLVDWENTQAACQEPTPEEFVHCRDIQQAWKEALNELPEIQREIFYLKRMEKMSTLEIAAHYNITQRSVQRHLAVTFKFLHDRLN